jgi:hypothetical protein
MAWLGGCWLPLAKMPNAPLALEVGEVVMRHLRLSPHDLRIAQ